MTWINIKDQFPDINNKIIGLCKDCGYPHLLYQDYGNWVMPEWCGERGYLTSGRTIDFEYWMPLPELPHAL